LLKRRERRLSQELDRHKQKTRLKKLETFADLPLENKEKA